MPRLVILTGQPVNEPARALAAALQELGSPPLAILIDPIRGGRPRFPEPPLWRKYLRLLRAGMLRYAFAKFRQGLRRRTRGRQPDLEAWARARGLTTQRIFNINTPDSLRLLQELRPDVLVMMGCRILQPEVLRSARLAMNFHTGLLPDYRGGDSIYWAMRLGDFDRVGFSIHEGVEALDAGRVFYEERVPPRPGDLIEDIYLRCVERATPQWVRLLREFAQAGDLPSRANDPNDGEIFRTVDWWEHAQVEAAWLRNGSKQAE